MNTSKTEDEEAELTVKQWLAIRKKAGLAIDPDTALVCWEYGQIMDPYGVLSNIPEDRLCVGRLYFARDVKSDTWVSYYDLPKATLEALWRKQEFARKSGKPFFEEDFEDFIPW